MLKQRPFLIETLTAIGLIVAPFVLPHLGFAPNTVNRILVWGLFGIGFDILFGFTGLLSFGQSAFYGTGGFVAAYLLTRAGFPYVVPALVIGMIAAAAVGYRVSTSGAAERQGIVHRLDVGTSGLMVVAKTEHAYTVLKRAFKERTVDKVYHAVVQGHQ